MLERLNRKEHPMTKHLADHRKASQGGRVKHFLRIAQDGSSSVWRRLFQQPRSRSDSNRRTLEYIRIDHGRDDFSGR